MAERRLEVVLALKDKFSKGIGQSQSKLERFSGTAKKAGVAVTAFGVGGALALNKFISSSREQEIGINRLNQSLKNVGTTYAENEAQIEKNIAAIQNKTNFGDEMQRDALQKLVTIGGKWEGSLDALAVTTDVAAGANIDLNAAALLVGKAIAGETSSLSRYGIMLEKGATQTEIMAALTAQFGGAAEAAADPITQMKNRLGDTAQVIGDQLLPFVDSIAREVERFANWINELNPSLVKWIAIGTAVAVALALIVGPMLLMIGFLPLLITGFATLGLTMSAALLGIPILIAAIIAGAVLMKKNWDEVKQVVETAINFILAGISRYINVYIKMIKAMIKGANVILGFFGKKIPDTLDEVNLKIDITGEKVEELGGEVEDTADTVVEGTEKMVGGFQSVGDAIEEVSNEAKAFASDFMSRVETDTQLRADIREQETEHIRQQMKIRAEEEAKSFDIAMDFANDFLARQEEQAEKRKEILNQETEFQKTVLKARSETQEKNAELEIALAKETAKAKEVAEAESLVRIAKLQGVVNERAEAFLRSTLPTRETIPEGQQSLLANLATRNAERLARIAEIEGMLKAGTAGNVGSAKRARLEAELAKLSGQKSVAVGIGGQLGDKPLPGFGGAPLPIQKVVQAGSSGFIQTVIAPNLTHMTDLDGVSIVSGTEAARVSEDTQVSFQNGRASNF